MRTLAIVGPTATGKSSLALDLAVRPGVAPAEIVNGDAMQLYRGMDIGTAKTPAEQRSQVPHHLVDVLEVTQEASVAAYQAQARRAVADILDRGSQPIVVGGSGLYLRALLDDFEFPETDPALRRELEARAEAEGPGALHRELARLDPQAADRIGSSNTRRLVRALEVYALTGRPLSGRLPTYRAQPGHSEPLQLGIAMSRAEMDARIAVRAAQMFAGGLLAETEELLARGLADGVTARRAIGYAQAISVVRGDLDVDAAVEQTVVATRQMARRQEKWFRRDPRIHWLAPGSELPERALALLR